MRKRIDLQNEEYYTDLIFGVKEYTKIRQIENNLSTNILTLDYLNRAVKVIPPNEILDAIELNNKKIEFVLEKNSKPSRSGYTRPIWIKDSNRFIDDINKICSDFENKLICSEVMQSLNNHLNFIFERFLHSDYYDEKVEVNY